MRHLVLDRILNSDHGVFGVLDVDGFKFMTAEEEWKGNVRNESCIPSGAYEMQRTVYHRYGYETFEITEVPGRSRILVHPGNTEEDTQGCVLLGLTLGFLNVRYDEEERRPNKKLAVLKSRVAFHKFMELMGTDERATIEVKWHDG